LVDASGAARAGIGKSDGAPDGAAAKAAKPAPVVAI
jgi:hypothetical protein